MGVKERKQLRQSYRPYEARLKRRARRPLSGAQSARSATDRIDPGGAARGNVARE